MPKPNPYNRACPSQSILALIGGKWSMLIVCALRAGPRRTDDLKRRLDGVSAKMLTQTLRELERHGMVERTVLATMPPQVEYAQTALGRGFLAAASALCEWTGANVEALESARAAFDRIDRSAS